jgi:hypothetical protein
MNLKKVTDNFQKPKVTKHLHVEAYNGFGPRKSLD